MRTAWGSEGEPSSRKRGGWRSHSVIVTWAGVSATSTRSSGSRPLVHVIRTRPPTGSHCSQEAATSRLSKSSGLRGSSCSRSPSSVTRTDSARGLGANPGRFLRMNRPRSVRGLNGSGYPSSAWRRANARASSPSGGSASMYAAQSSTPWARRYAPIRRKVMTALPIRPRVPGSRAPPSDSADATHERRSRQRMVNDTFAVPCCPPRRPPSASRCTCPCRAPWRAARASALGRPRRCRWRRRPGACTPSPSSASSSARPRTCCPS